MNKAFLASEFVPSSPESALFHIIPCPYEASVSYGKGTSKGPLAILEASQQLEAYDGKSFPGSKGIFTQEIFDFNNTPRAVLQTIQNITNMSLAYNALPILLGGEHTISFGALSALYNKFGHFGIVHFDAHADLRSQYDGTKYSHACVFNRALSELGLELVQIGVRDLCLEEVEFRKKYNITCHDAENLVEHGLPLRPLPENFPQLIYISFDVDALDPSIMPATGTPVPGGLNWYDTLKLLNSCVKNRTVIGFDVVEFAPIPSLHFADYTIAKLIYLMMGIIEREAKVIKNI